jgi:hypothetical protein
MLYFRTLKDEYGNPLSEKLIPRGENSANSSPLPEFTTRSEPSFADNDDITSDLDDTDDDDANADGEETQNIILCLYDKVNTKKRPFKFLLGVTALILLFCSLGYAHKE